jgi:hypothetical protein
MSRQMELKEALHYVRALRLCGSVNLPEIRSALDIAIDLIRKEVIEQVAKKKAGSGGKKKAK